MGTPQQEQYPKLRCRKCESVLGKPQCIPRDKVVLYGVVLNRHGAFLRRCSNCAQLWLAYVQELPNHGMKIIMKMIDKEL